MHKNNFNISREKNSNSLTTSKNHQIPNSKQKHIRRHSYHFFYFGKSSNKLFSVTMEPKSSPNLNSYKFLVPPQASDTDSILVPKYRINSNAKENQNSTKNKDKTIVLNSKMSTNSKPDLILNQTPSITNFNVILEPIKPIESNLALKNTVSNNNSILIPSDGSNQQEIKQDSKSPIQNKNTNQDSYFQQNKNSNLCFEPIKNSNDDISINFSSKENIDSILIPNKNEHICIKTETNKNFQSDLNFVPIQNENLVILSVPKNNSECLISNQSNIECIKSHDKYFYIQKVPLNSAKQ